MRRQQSKATNILRNNYIQSRITHPNKLLAKCNNKISSHFQTCTSFVLAFYVSFLSKLLGDSRQLNECVNQEACLRHAGKRIPVIRGKRKCLCDGESKSLEDGGAAGPPDKQLRFVQKECLSGN